MLILDMADFIGQLLKLRPKQPVPTAVFPAQSARPS